MAGGLVNFSFLLRASVVFIIRSPSVPSQRGTDDKNEYMFVSSPGGDWFPYLVAELSLKNFIKIFFTATAELIRQTSAKRWFVLLTWGFTPRVPLRGSKTGPFGTSREATRPKNIYIF